jgi:hypothetical protein
MGKALRNQVEYGQDFYAWIKQQAEMLRSGDVEVIDRENIAEELESMGNSQRHALGSELQKVMLHMLKLQLQPARRTRSWILSIFNGRNAIADLLEISPSLRRELETMFEKHYPRAVKAAAIQTGIALRRLPKVPPFSLAQVLGDDPFEPETEAQPPSE